MRLYEILYQHVKSRPGQTYFYSPYGPVSYSQFHSVIKALYKAVAAKAAAGFPRTLALSLDDPTALLFYAWLGIFAEADLVLLPGLNAVPQTLSERDPAFVLVSDSVELQEQAIQLPLEAIMKDVLAGEMPAEEELTDFAPRNAAIFFYTSGTTAAPKLVEIGHGQFTKAINTLFALKQMPYTIDQTVLVTPPLFHSYGLSAMLEYAFGGSALVLPQERSFVGPVKRLMDAGIGELVTAIEGVPYFYRQLAAFGSRLRLPCLKHMGFGGEAVSSALLQTIKNDYPGITCSIRYGLTETPSVITLQSGPVETIDITNSGLPLPIYTLKIEPGADDGPGAIYVRGECLSVTAASPGNFYDTGDLGFLDAIKGLQITGRTKSMLKSKGFRLNPAMVEEILFAIEGVEDCLVYLESEKLTARIVAKEGIALNEKEIKRVLALKLPDYAVPEVILAVPVIERTGSGKLKRQAIPGL